MAIFLPWESRLELSVLYALRTALESAGEKSWLCRITQIKYRQFPLVLPSNASL